MADDLSVPGVSGAAPRWGRIRAADGRVVSVRRRWLPLSASIVETLYLAGIGRPRDGVCVVDYHVDRGSPDYVTLDMVHSARRTGLATVMAAERCLDAIARQRAARGIVAHVTNPRITDRLLRRLGWVPHQTHWRGRHWIKRFE